MSGAASSVPSCWLNDSMLGALDDIVGPSSHQIACIHNDRVGDWGGIDESSLGTLHL